MSDDASCYSQPPSPDRGSQRYDCPTRGGPRYGGWWFLISKLIALLFAALAMGLVYAAMPVVAAGVAVFRGGRAVVRRWRRWRRTPKAAPQ